MLYRVHPENPQPRTMQMVSKILADGGVCILPTDTVYAFVTTLNHKKSIERLYRLKAMPANKPLALYCRDFSQSSEFIKLNNNQVFRWMKSHLPGPYTLVLPASHRIPHYTLRKQKTVGVRIISHSVIEALLQQLDFPLIGTSIPQQENYLVYADELEEEYGKLVDVVVDSGPLQHEPSTILDACDFPMQIIRQGKGEFSPE